MSEIDGGIAEGETRLERPRSLHGCPAKEQPANAPAPNKPLPGTLPDELARKIGVAPPLPGEAGPEPQTMMDWAMHWAQQGLHVFPADSYVGNPLVEKWHRAATNDTSKIAEWWSEFPDADIAVVPDASKYFVIGVVGKIGLASLHRIERDYGKLEPAFVIKNRWGNQYLWFTGSAFSSHDKLGQGVHVFGAGRYLFLPPSLTRIAEELPADQRGKANYAG